MQKLLKTIQIMEFKISDSVHYIPFDGCNVDQIENGIVKSLCEDSQYVFVVYHCADDWAHYQDYTGNRTNINQLKPGWKH